LTVCLGLVAGTVVITVCCLLPPLAGLRPLLPLLVITLLAESIQQTPQLLAQQAFRFRELAVIELTATGTWLVVILIGAFTFPNVTTLLIARALEALVRGIALVAWYPDGIFRGEITPAVWRYFGRFVRVLGPQAWLENAFSNLDVLILRQFVGDAELGVYDRTQQLLRIPLSLSINLVDRVAGAAYSRDQADPWLLRRSVLQFSVLIIAGTLAGLAALQTFLTIFARPILGEGWATGIATLLPWALPFCLLRPLVWNFNICFQATGRPLQLLLALATMTTVLLFTGWGFTSLWGSRGMLLALGASYFTVLVAPWYWFGCVPHDSSGTGTRGPARTVVG
jgi:O-antigen/teichoic acid export membrane protein